MTVMSFAIGDDTVRVLVIDGQPWFVTADICRLLDIPSAMSAVATLSDDSKGSRLIDTPTGRAVVQIISESGVYVLAHRSGMTGWFKDWLAAEVHPAVRMTLNANVGRLQEEVDQLEMYRHRGNTAADKYAQALTELGAARTALAGAPKTGGAK